MPSRPGPLLSPVDVVIVGGGVAGLAAAAPLSAAGLRVRILEARQRLGGRVCTRTVPGLSTPIELGAEFLHGEAERTEALAAPIPLTVLDVGGRRWESSARGLRPLDDFWQRLDRVMRRPDGDREHDRSFAEFLARRPGGRSLARDRRLAEQFVRGFHAADPALAGEKALADGGSPRGDEGEKRLARIAEGYDRVVDALAERAGAEVSTGCVVRALRWRDDGVSVVATTASSHAMSVDADFAIITVPLGVLCAPAGAEGAIAFDPALPRRVTDRLRQLHMGHVTRATLHLDAPVWDLRPGQLRNAATRLRRLSFLHADDGAMPVCWTAYPAESPTLVAWFGGPEGEALAMRDDADDAIIRRTADRLHLGHATFRRHVVAVHRHDWTNDPFSRGAYSYVGVGGAGAAAALARPVGGRLMLAGEAVAPGGQNGTVEGAIGSGEAAARRILSRTGRR